MYRRWAQCTEAVRTMCAGRQGTEQTAWQLPRDPDRTATLSCSPTSRHFPTASKIGSTRHSCPPRATAALLTPARTHKSPACRRREKGEDVTHTHGGGHPASRDSTGGPGGVVCVLLPAEGSEGSGARRQSGVAGLTGHGACSSAGTEAWSAGARVLGLHAVLGRGQKHGKAPQCGEWGRAGVVLSPQ